MLIVDGMQADWGGRGEKTLRGLQGATGVRPRKDREASSQQLCRIQAGVAMGLKLGIQRRSVLEPDVSEYQGQRIHLREVPRRTRPHEPAPVAQKRRFLRPWVETLLCFVAVFGLGASLKADFENVRTREYVATDYKTLYASAALFREGGNPFSTSEIIPIYGQSGVDLPRNMFGHMPVYPPVTLLALWPFTYLSMGHSAVIWLFSSMLAVAAAAAMLLAEARAQKLHWSVRLLLLAFVVGTPMLGYALDIGNVSPAVGALATISLLIAVKDSNRKKVERRWQSLAAGAACLGAALCLKPHLAIWILVGIALICGKVGRVMAGLAGTIFVIGNAWSAFILWNRGVVREVLGSFVTMLESERGSGSMAPASREVLHVKSQITGLDSLLGLWIQPPWREAIIAVVLVVLFGFLLFAAKRNGWMSRDRNWQILFTSSLFSVGMLVSYHRAHDAVILPGLLGLWLVDAGRTIAAERLLKAKRWLYAAGSTAVLTMLAGCWFGMPRSVAAKIAGWCHAMAIRDLLTLRQAALFAVGMAVTLTALTWLTGRERQKDGTDFLGSVPGGQ